MEKFDLGEHLLRDSENRQDDSLQRSIEKATMRDAPVIVSQIANLPNETQRAHYIEKLSKALKIPKAAIKQDLKSLCGVKKKGTEQQTVFNASFPGLVDLVMDNGEVFYLIKTNGLLHTEREWRSDDDTRLKPPAVEDLPFALPSGEKVMAYYINDNDKKLFDDLVIHLKRFSFLQEEQWLILGFFTFLTYIQDHPDIHYLPMVLFYAVPERGKSRTGKSLAMVSYRGVHVVDMREANLFRYSQNIRATLFLDIMDLWKKAERNGCEDILLLRFEKGAKVSRVLYPDKGAFQDTRHYDVFGPTIMATNEAVHKILDTRCIPITMPNRPGYYDNPLVEEAVPFKERLIAWRARNINNPLREVQPVPGITGRLWDITRPMFQVCSMISPDQYNNLADAIRGVAGERVSEKRESIEGRIIEIINDMSAGNVGEWQLKTSDVLERFNQGIRDEQKRTSQWLGRKLKGLGIKTDTRTGRSMITMTSATLEPLLEQYGHTKNIYVCTLGNNSENSENSNQPINTGGYTSEFRFEFPGNSQNSRQLSKEQPIDITKSIELPEFSEFFQSVRKKENFDGEIEVLEVIDEEEKSP